MNSQLKCKTKSKYKTKQREILLDYFESAPGVHITAGDVCEYLKAQGAAIGKSTVYRQLESLVDEGVLNKYIIDGNTPACFEYLPGEHHGEGPVSFHCKCEKCGRLIHLQSNELGMIQSHLYDEHRFRLNTARTVFYGVCDRCI